MEKKWLPGLWCCRLLFSIILLISNSGVVTGSSATPVGRVVDDQNRIELNNDAPQKQTINLSNDFSIFLPIIQKSMLPGMWYWMQGPPYGKINVLKASKSNPAILYAATDAGVFKSLDGGNNWSIAGLNDIGVGMVYGLDIHPSNPNIVYAAAMKNIYRTTDGGLNWDLLTKGVFYNEVFLSIAINPNNPNTIYASRLGYPSYAPVFIKSVDGGDHWFSPGEGIVPGNTIKISSNGWIYVSSNYNACSFGRSKNDGETWECLGDLNGNQKTDDNVEAFALGEQNPNLILAMGSIGVFRSIDYGDTWSKLFDWPWDGVMIDPLEPTRAYYSWDFRSFDSGLTWNYVPNNRPVYAWGRKLEAAIVDGTTHLLMSSELGAYKSTDQMNSWIDINKGLGVSSVTAVAISPSDPESFLVGTWGGGIFRGRQGSLIWDQLKWDVSGIRISSLDVYAAAIDSQDPDLIYVSTRGYFLISNDGGSIWNTVPYRSGYTYSSVVVTDPHTKGTAYVADGNTIYRTINGGISWEAFLVSDNVNIYDLAISNINPNILYVSANDGVYRSINNGETWEKKSNGLPNTGWFAIAISPLSDETIYSGTQLGIVHRSTNSGDTWSKLNMAIPLKCEWDAVISDLLVDFKNSNRLYMSLGKPGSWSPNSYCGGLFQSKDGGITWESMTMTLPNSDFWFRQLTYNPNSDVLYAGSQVFGVWSYQIDR